jgi:hypothetical protein
MVRASRKRSADVAVDNGQCQPKAVAEPHAAEADAVQKSNTAHRAKRAPKAAKQPGATPCASRDMEKALWAKVWVACMHVSKPQHQVATAGQLCNDVLHHRAWLV